MSKQQLPPTSVDCEKMANWFCRKAEDQDAKRGSALARGDTGAAVDHGNEAEKYRESERALRAEAARLRSREANDGKQ
jgi:hypothetical protein